MTLRSIAKALLEQHAMDIVEAKKHVDEALADPSLRQHFQQFVRQVFLNDLDAVWLDQRDTARQAGPMRSARWERVMATATDAVLMNWPLSPATGLTLGEASKNDLLQWMKQKRARLVTEQTDLSFVAGVAEALKRPTDTVKAHLKEADLRQIRRKAERAVSPTSEAIPV